MFRFISRAGLLVVALGTLSGATVGLAGVASASNGGGLPIGPNQRFVGVVNGKDANAGILVVCGLKGGTGADLGGQTLEVLPPVSISPKNGRTGVGTHKIEANLFYTIGNIAVLAPLRTFSDYGVQKTIPYMTVPCGGTGYVEFTPVNSSGSGRTYSVKVSFLNVAVKPV
jgi:hypothetical protein